jgi:uncharacterized membrane protein
VKIAIAAVILAFLLPAVLYDRLPDPMPSHFNFQGEIDGWMPKPWGAFLLPLVMAGVLAMLAALPRISPKGFEVDGSSRAFAAITLATTGLLLMIHLSVLLISMGVAVPIAALMPVLLGAMLAGIGNYLSKVPRNFFIGIRTPWTLADEDVWFRTHRLGGRTFVAAGLLLIVVGPFLRGPSALAVIPALVVTAAVIPLVYSYITYRKGHQS